MTSNLRYREKHWHLFCRLIKAAAIASSFKLKILWLQEVRNRQIVRLAASDFILYFIFHLFWSFVHRPGIKKLVQRSPLPVIPGRRPESYISRKLHEIATMKHLLRVKKTRNRAFVRKRAINTKKLTFRRSQKLPKPCFWMTSQKLGGEVLSIFNKRSNRRHWKFWSR